MPSKENEIQFNDYRKFNKVSFIIYADLEFFIENINGYKDNSKHLLKTKVDEHIPSCFLISVKSSFKDRKNRHDVYRSKDCMKMFFQYIREHAIKTINFENKKLKLSAKE